MRNLVPKYSDRLNFFFVIYDKEVPMKKDFGTILEKLQSKIDTTAKVDRILMETLTLAARTDRDSNHLQLVEIDAQNKNLDTLRTILSNFFSAAENVFSHSCSNHQKTHDLLTLLASTVTVVNFLLWNVDNTWLPKYGSISAECLHYDSPIEFLELLPIATKILGKELENKRILRKLQSEIGPLRTHFSKTQFRPKFTHF